jgi:tetratricopeptide (TPR) repeat protein
LKTPVHFLITFVLGGVFTVASQARPLVRPEAQPSLAGERGVQQSPSKEAEEFVRQALEQYRQGKFDEALANCTKASRLSPTDYRPHVLSGYVYMAQMKLKSASDAFASAIQLHPQDTQLYLLKAAADARRGAKDEALAACRKALDLDPNLAEAHAMVGETLRWDEKRRNEAIAAYQAAIKINPNLLPVYEPLGELLDAAADQKEAEAVFRRGIAADPKGMTGRFALGRMLVKQGRLAEARQIWAGRTSDDDNSFPNFITLLDRAEKLKAATDALAQRPNDPDALVAMGLAVMEGDSWVVDSRQERAVEYFRQALKSKPDHASAQYAICKAYIQLAGIFKDKKKLVDDELAKMRQLNAKLADELVEYRKNYTGGIPGGPPVNLNK